MKVEAISKAVEILGGQAALARACGITQPAVHKWLAGKSSGNPRYASIIEKATEGKVKRKELCPELFAEDQPSTPTENPCPAPSCPSPTCTSVPSASA